MTFQTYGSTPPIAGVCLHPLVKRRDDNGWFMEWLRLRDGRPEVPADLPPLGQLSVSFAGPGRLNAFHIHPRRGQSELWTVVKGQLLVWLVDCRAAASTTGARQRLILSGEEPAVLVVPGGVAHGYRAGAAGALLLYAVDRQFDAADPDEGRLPWDQFGPGLWEPDRG